MDAMGKEFVHRIQSDVILVEGRSPSYLEQYIICLYIQLINKELYVIMICHDS